MLPPMLASSMPHNNTQNCLGYIPRRFRNRVSIKALLMPRIVHPVPKTRREDKTGGFPSGRARSNSIQVPGTSEVPGTF